MRRPSAVAAKIHANFNLTDNLLLKPSKINNRSLRYSPAYELDWLATLGKRQ